MDYKTIKLDDVQAWCEENKQMEWFIPAYENMTSFLTLKKQFVKKFMPEIYPAAKPKNKKERLASLKEKYSK